MCRTASPYLIAIQRDRQGAGEEVGMGRGGLRHALNGANGIEGKHPKNFAFWNLVLAFKMPRN